METTIKTNGELLIVNCPNKQTAVTLGKMVKALFEMKQAVGSDEFIKGSVQTMYNSLKYKAAEQTLQTAIMTGPTMMLEFVLDINEEEEQK